jgi:hypothetical protein
VEAVFLPFFKVVINFLAFLILLPTFVTYCHKIEIVDLVLRAQNIHAFLHDLISQAKFLQEGYSSYVVSLLVVAQRKGEIHLLVFRRDGFCACND